MQLSTVKILKLPHINGRSKFLRNLIEEFLKLKNTSIELKLRHGYLAHFKEIQAYCSNLFLPVQQSHFWPNPSRIQYLTLFKEIQAQQYRITPVTLDKLLSPMLHQRTPYFN